MSVILEFSNREDFGKWLFDNCLSSVGIWLLFDKAGGPKTIKASEALEEALCFEWIDGQNGKWLEKNKALVKNLEELGLISLCKFSGNVLIGKENLYSSIF